MKLCNDVITVFNPHINVNSGDDDYYGTVIAGVHWFCATKSTVNTKGLESANQIIIRIPVDADFGGKQYVPPKEYASMDDTSNAFTLSTGSIIVLGNAPESAPRRAYLFEQYSDITTVTAVTGNTTAPNAPHWRVTGS